MSNEQPTGISFRFQIEEEDSPFILKTPVEIYIPDAKHRFTVQAIWDTGASISAISPKMITALHLRGKHTDEVECTTVNGPKKVKIYTVAIDLGAGMNVPALQVAGTKFCRTTDGIDVLIGMDIIATGFLSLYPQDGHLHMSFKK